MWFTRVSINNPVFATMVMAALCVLGLFSYSQLRVERMPDITPPIVFVAVAYPGASPEAVETELTRPIELSLNGIAGVKMIRSNTLEGPQRDGGRVPGLGRHEPRRPGRARQGRGGAAELPARRQAAVRLALRRRQRPADGLPVAARPASAARASCRCSPTRSVRKRLERATGVARVDVGGPDGAPGPHRPRPAAPARASADAGRRLDGAAARQRRHAGGPAQRHEGRRDRPRRGQGEGCQGVRRHRRRDAQRQRHPPRRPRHAGRARARARLDLARRRRAVDLVPGLQAAGRQHRRDRRGDQGRRRGAAARRCRRASSCAWSTPTATGSRARSRASRRR